MKETKVTYDHIMIKRAKKRSGRGKDRAMLHWIYLSVLHFCTVRTLLVYLSGSQ